MPRRSIWKGSFVDAFLLRMKKKRDFLFNRSHVDLLFRRNSLIAPYEFTMEKLLFIVRLLQGS
uniref:Ribosomal protein S19 n=1 Tax=Psychotria viridis TaxID=189196 RepID=A0A977KCT5_9GENT|nr:ribosomal protein S19 [Psychotria viridis]UXD78717.1 ribosomal protein S19 [Psychotria viridis]UXD78761.1 ribosomal protein S19 [Psychotria viridis]